MFNNYQHQTKSIEEIITIITNKKVVFYDSEFIRINCRFELLQIGATDLKNNFEMKVKHIKPIPIREQVLLGLDKEGYSKIGFDFPVVFEKFIEWLNKLKFDYIVAFEYHEDLAILKAECDKHNLPPPNFSEKIIDVSKLIHTYYGLTNQISLKNMCSIFDVDLDLRYKNNFHDAFADAYNTGLLCESFLNNINNSEIDKDSIEGFIYIISSYNNWLEQNVRKVKRSQLVKKCSGFQYKNSLFKNSNYEMRKFMLLNSIPNNKKENTKFMFGVNKALRKCLKGD